MCAYSSINGAFACQNPTLLNTTLKQLWDFQGFVTSDYAALHDVSGAADGTDQEQPFADSFGATLEQDVQNGTVPRAVAQHDGVADAHRDVPLRHHRSPAHGHPV